MRELTIGTAQGKPLKLPLDLVTQTVAILARKRVGKTYTASVVAEEFAEAGIPFVVLDPTGAWWGLRSSLDGKSDGYPVIVIGGAHGDVPLDPASGKIVADLVVERPGFYIVDLSQTAPNAEQDRFAQDFAERLYRAKEKHRFPLHLIVDEADSFAPQRPFPGQQRMLGAFEAIVRRGGIRGLGLTMITQRPAVLNKNVLTQCEVLIVLQMTGPQDQDAIDDWVSRNGTKAQRDTMMGSLASLQRGEAWLWSPSWLQIFERVNIRQRRTWNSSETPRAGETRIEPAKLAPVDLAKLRSDIQAAVERAKQEDPEQLRQEIRRLKAELVKRPTATAAVEIPVLTPEHTALLAKVADAIELYQQRVDRETNVLAEMQQGVKSIAESVNSKPHTHAPIARAVPPLARLQVKPSRGPSATDQSIGGGMRRMMIALAQRGRLTRRQLGLRASISSSSGTFNIYLARMRTREWITGDPFELTQSGLDALGKYDPLPEGIELQAYWLRELGGGAGRILSALCEAHPQALTRERLGELAEMSPSSGTFNTYLSRLRTLELIEGKSRRRMSCSTDHATA